ncbi:histone H3 h3.3 [Ciborinia camelliae]|nr:histone H3 h3.3 [Ciborinia camelliae]
MRAKNVHSKLGWPKRKPSKARGSKGGKRRTVSGKAPRKTLPSRNSSARAGLVKRARQYKPGTVALREIRRIQGAHELLLPRTTFARLVHELVVDLKSSQGVNRIQLSAVAALQEAVEAFLISEFEIQTLRHRMTGAKIPGGE